MNLRVINGLEDGWENDLQKAAESGRNFVLVLKDAVRDLLKVCNLLGEQRVPDKLERWGIYGLYDVIEKSRFVLLLSKFKTHDVFLVEQLFLNRNKPPRRKPFLVYCEVRGIISEHESEDQALQSFGAYADYFPRMKALPLAGVYRWDESHWHKLT